MKKRIRLTEGKLHKLIEQAINELDIRTKANAAKKAEREWSSYLGKAINKSNNSIKRNYARQMADKRFRQLGTFMDALYKDLPKNTYYSNFGRRGELSVDKPVTYDDEGEHEERHGFGKQIRNMAEYLQGNSYYDKKRGRWLNPGDEGYDMEKSEPWAKIRRENESLARRVTESIMRKLRRM